MEKKKKVIFGVMVFLGIAAILFLLLQKGKEGGRVSRPVPTRQAAAATPIPVSTSGPSQKESVPAKLVAAKAIEFLDRQKKPDGFYKFFAVKKEEKVVPQANMWAVRGRLAYYQHFSKNARDLSQAEEDAEALLQFCQKDYRECIVTLTPILELYRVTRKDEYKNFLIQVGNILLQPVAVDRQVMSLGAQARELALLYEELVSPRFLQQAYKRLAEAVEVSKAQQAYYQKPDEEVCYIVLAQTEIGRIGKDEALLTEAKRFFTEGNYQQVPDQLTLIQPCIESALLFGTELGDTQIGKLGAELLQNVIVGHWQEPRAIASGVEGGFSVGRGGGLTNITDAGYMLYLLGQEQK